MTNRQKWNIERLVRIKEFNRRYNNKKSIEITEDDIIRMESSTKLSTEDVLDYLENILVKGEKVKKDHKWSQYE